MGLLTILIFGAIAVAAAYVLGTYLRHKEETPVETAPASLFRRLARPVDDPQTEALVHWLLSQAFEQTGVRIADDELAYGRIVEAAVRALAQLKKDDPTTISLPFLTADASGPKHFETRVTRRLVKELVRD